MASSTTLQYKLDSMAGIVFLGTGGTFSRVALEGVLAAGVEVRAVVVPGIRFRELSRPRRQVQEPAPRAVQVAWAHDVRVIELRSPGDTEATRLIGELQPQALAVACFPWLLPRAWRELAPGGVLNLHPSLLPAYRGPAPLFWQLRAGETRTGVTLHRIDAGIDTGDILSRKEVPFPDGLGREGLEALLAEAGAALLAEAARSWPLAGSRQPETGASHQGPPHLDDLELSTTWPARRAFNFIRGAVGWGPFAIVTGSGRWTATEALSFSSEGGAPGSVRAVADGTEIGFSPGTVVIPPSS
jgi:methionyl-tRNA formyltransferase